MSQTVRQLDPITEEITPADHYVLCCGGTSSNLELLPSRLRKSKNTSPDLRKQIEELAYESSYLRAELKWHKETKQILLDLQERVHDIFQTMEDTLARAAARLHESERRYFQLWELDPASEEGGRF
jgi:chromosome segregation ATPase